MFKTISIILFSFIFIGCGSHVQWIYLSNGEGAYSVECKTEHQCMKRISNECGSDGYYVLHESQLGNKRSVVFRCRN